MAAALAAATKTALKARHFIARMAEVGQQATRRRSPPTLSVATSGNGRLQQGGVGGGGGGGGGDGSAARRSWRRRRRIGERARSPLARIIGIKRPICRPMIASPSTTWFDSAPARLLGRRHAQLPLGKLRYGQLTADSTACQSARWGVLEARRRC